MIIQGIKSFNLSFFPMFTLVTFFVLTYTTIITLGGNLTSELKFINTIMVLFTLASGVLASQSLIDNRPKGILAVLYFLVFLWTRIIFLLSIIVSLLLCFDRSKYYIANHLRNWFGTKVLHGEDYIFLFGLFVLLIFGLSILKIGKEEEKTKKYFFIISTVILISGLAVQGLIGFSISAIALIKPIITYPSAGYDWKMRFQIGPFYDYTRFVNENTPPDAVFLEPPMIMPWPLIGNEGYTRYFIFPRELVKEEADEARKKKITHIFIVGRKEGQWPTTKIKSKRLIYMPENPGEEPIVVEKDYDPQDPINDLWGIIEI